MAHTIDLNADLGEGFAHDPVLMPLISSANIACGGHAGDVDSMRTAVRLARIHGVVVGAHPSYPDREHFGRVSMQLEPMRLVEILTAQLWSLKAVCIEAGLSVAYVKPHGALYNDAARDPALARLIAGSIHEIDPALAVMGLSGSALLDAARECGLTVIAEAFVDRAYRNDGSLVPRGEPGAVLADPQHALAQAADLTLRGGVRAQDGTWLPLQADSLCLHGDHPHALHFATLLHAHLRQQGVQIASTLQRRAQGAVQT
ncbi:5-oxoprolinase subunit PxpA [Chitiniphilus purpureus]|uniref:5-oxoprolinase subunit PxpA n=1 Tax=Chitiniphilus purpureus TaxID=2981137 RepID=A0ABY6DPG7_9NEIS|nr:5-oxoprolinase subunit PxpA [Chitiniphilus sp. CD1]UXY16249.1 5-oxoprolinase subunit PxpA [Chitiniphilus sp. CD1]